MSDSAVAPATWNTSSSFQEVGTPTSWNVEDRYFPEVFERVVRVLLHKKLDANRVRVVSYRDMLRRVTPISFSHKWGKSDVPAVTTTFRDWFKSNFSSGFVGVYPHVADSSLEYTIVRDSGDFRMVTTLKGEELADSSAVDVLISKTVRPPRDPEAGKKRKAPAEGGAKKKKAAVSATVPESL